MGEEDEKGKPIPTRFDKAESKMVTDLAKRTRLSKSEIIRRCVRYAASVIASEGPAVLYEVPAPEHALRRQQKK